MKHTPEQEKILQIQQQHMEIWKGKLNAETYRELKAWVDQCNKFIQPGTEPYAIVRGEDLTRFILNYQPMKNRTPELTDLPRFREAILNIQTIPLSEIGWLVGVAWEKPHYGAVPYIDALKQLTNIDDRCLCETAESIVLYFLSNAATWRGPVARLVKTELNKRIKSL